MNNPLNELSAVYNQQIAEGCGCDEKKKVKLKVELPGTKRPDGGDGAAPNDGKNLLATGNVPMGGSGAKRRVSKYAVEPLSSEGYAPGDVDKKVGAVTSIPKDERDAAKERLLAKAKKKREAMKEGHCDVEGVECSPTEKKKDAKKMKKESKIYSNWREDWEYLDEYASGITGYGSGDSENNLGKTKAKTDDKANQKIVEKNIKNKIKINPPQGMNEAFNEIGGQLVEMYEIELDENTVEQDRRLQNQKMVLAKKQDNLNRQREQRNQQAKVAAARGSQNNSTSPMTEETEEEKEKRKREMLARTKDHDDRHDGKLAESDFPKDAPSIKDKDAAHKKQVKTHVKRYPGLGYAPTIKQEMKEGRALAGVISTIRSKNGMSSITSKGKDKLQDKKDKSMCEAAPLAAKAAVVAGTVAKKVIGTGLNMMKEPIKKSVEKLRTNEELSIDDQMRISRDAAKNRNPKPDHKAIRGKMLKKSLPKDNRSDAQKMTDATGPRKGSNYRGD